MPDEPKPSSSAEELRSLRALWLQIRKEEGAKTLHQTERWLLFLHGMEHLITSPDHPSLREVVDHREELCGALARRFAGHGHKILEAANADVVASTASDPLMNLLLSSILAILSRRNLPKSEVILLSRSYEVCGQHNLVHLAISLHGQLMEALGDGVASDEQMDQVAEVDGKYLALAKSILSCPQRELIRRSLAEGTTLSALEKSVATFITAYTRPFKHCDRLAQASLELFHVLLLLAPRKEAVESVLVRLESVVDGTPAAGLAAERGQLSVASITCMMECIVTAKEFIGFRSPESLSTTSLASAILALEAWLDDQPALCDRLVACLHIMAVRPRTPYTTPTPSASTSQPTPESKPAGLLQLLQPSIFHAQKRLVGALLSAVGPSTGHTSTHAAPQQVYCPDVVDCISQVFVCSSRSQVTTAFGRELLQLLGAPGVSVEFRRSVLLACLESAGTMGDLHWHLLLDFLQEKCSGEEGTPIVAALLHCMTHSPQTFSSPFSAALVLNYLLQHMSKCELAGWMAEKGVLSAGVEMVRCAVTAPPASNDDSGYDEQVGVLAQKLSSLVSMSLSSTSEAPSSVMVTCTQSVLDIMLHARTNAHRFELTFRVLLQLYQRMARRCGCRALVQEIARVSDSHPWHPNTSFLLALLSSVLPPGGLEAIHNNAIELLLSMVPNLDDSHKAELDVFFISRALSLLLPPVRDSDIWTAVEASLRPEQQHVQVLVDLCSGALHSTTARRATDHYLHHHDDDSEVMAFRSNMTLCEGCSVPTVVFGELDRPLHILMQWATAAAESDPLGPSMAKLALAFIRQTRAVLPLSILGPFCERWREGMSVLISSADSLHGLAPYLISPKEASAEVLRETQEVWLGLHDRPLLNAIHLGQSGGIAGRVDSRHLRWPLSEGFAIATWLRWSLLPRQQTFRLSVWQLRYRLPSLLTLEFMVDVEKRCCFYTHQHENQASQSVELPFIPPDVWVHVVINHHSPKLYQSKLEVLYDGVPRASADVMYPPIPNSGIAGASATTSVKSLHVCVGAADGSPNLGTHLSIASLELFRSSLRMSEVVGLYCWGTEPSSMDGHVLPLAEAPILGSRVLRWIELQPKLLSLGDLSAESPRLTPPIYQATLLRLRARSVAMTNTRIDYLNAKTWGLINVSSGNGGPPLQPCVLHGCYAPIHRRHITYSDGFLSLGALEEWRSWMLHIEGMDAHGDAAACAMAAQLARQLVQVVGRCLVNRSEAMEMRWEQFITALAEHVLSLPFLYLHRSEVLESLLEVAIRQVGVDGQPVVYCSTLLGHIFLNWGVMSHMPTELLRVVLRQLEMLVGDSNAYRIVNVRRLHHADFFNGYVCGLFRHVLPLSVLGPAMKVVFYSLLADGPRGQLAMQMLQLCALSIPQEGDRWSPGAPLGSTLFFVGIHYIALVRNLLLKTVGDVWDVWPASTRQTFAETMTEHLPDCWYRTMTSATSHPVSAVLSMRCFMMCFLYSPRFREAHTMERSLVLLDSIASHAQQPDLLRCIHGGLLGQVWSMQDGGLAPSAVVAPPPPAKLAEVQPLLLMCLHLIKIRSLLLLRTEVMVEAPVSTHTYFLDAEALALQSSSQSCPRLRRWAVAVRCCVRLRRCREVGAEDPSPLSPIVQHRVAVSTFSNTLMTSIVEILDWAALHYKCDGELRKAMFRTGYHTNLINLAAWPLLCAIKGGTAGYVDPSAIVMGPSVDLPTSSSSSESGVEVGDSDELDDAVEAEASMTTVLPTHSKSYNMDNVIPVSGMERVFDACRTLFLTHAVERFATSELIFVRQGVRLTKFVASLHQNLSSEPAGVGNIAKDLRAAFLCTVWLKAAEQCLDGTDKATTHAHRNAVMMAKYVVDRLMSGEAVPPRGVANYLIFLLCKFHDWGDTPRIIHGYFFTWLLGILSNSFHARDAGRVQGSIRIAYTYMDTLFSSSVLTSSGSVGQLLRHLLETTEAFAGLPQSEGMDESGAELASLWLSLLTTSKNAVGPTSMRHLDSSPLLMAGLQLLLPPTPSKPSFVAWLRNNVDSIQAAHEHFRVFFFRDMRRGEGASHAHLLRHTTSSTERAYAAQYRRQWAAVQESEAAWMKTCLTSTAVDLATLRASPNFPSPCMADWIAENRPTRWHLHDNGMAGRRERSAIYPDAAYTTPLSAHVRYPPPAMISFRQVGELSSLGLQANATALLCRLCHVSSPAQLLWVGNVYLVVGSDCYPCTTVVTEAAVVVVSCCEVTRDGGICIARARTHTATMKSSLRPSLMVETLRRLLPSSSEAFMTSSKAAFRHSQYYRQLQMRTSADAATVVWRLPLGHLTTLHHRHFQHMPAGLELEMETGERFLLVALDEELSLSSPSRDKLQQALQRAAPHAACESLTTKRTRLEMHTRQWRRGQLTNADYLRSLNDAASRAVTDLGQYPIAPWVLTDYATSAVDLGQPAHFRDLTKPVGALDSGRAEKLQRRYAEWPAESEEPPFHHGTHYSSCAITLHYLLRLEPFTAASERFQGGHLDMPERLFHSVQEAWEGSSGPGTGDAKELIPEFFSLPHFLRNDNAASLGQRSDGTILGDVVLPPWSSSNAARFVLVHGLALESSCVSRTLHEWIDLIFGHKQQGAAAVRALNLFHHLSYREGIERAITAATSEEVRQSIVSSADQFGQTPPQLFTRPHPSQTSTPLPTLQKHFLSHLRDIQTVQERNAVVHGRPNASVDQLEWVDGAFHCGAGGRHALSSGKDTTYSYVAKVDAVGCFSGALLLYFCTPAIHQLGCGSFSCLNASAGVIYVGTDAGIVLVFVRGRHRCCFNLISVLHPPSAHRSAVLLLRSFSCGRLVATYERDALVMGWQTSLFAPMMAFTLTAVMGEDRSPVSAVVYDHQRNVFIGAKLEWIIIFASDGSMLSSVHLAQQMMSCVPEMPEASCLISTLALMSVSSFDEENMLVVGHQRGHLTFWVMKSATEISEGTPTAEILAVKRLLLPVLSFPHPVRSICPIPMRCSLGVGLANGEIHRIQFPLPETDSSDSD